MTNVLTTDQSPQGVIKTNEYWLDRWLATVGTVGDSTTLEYAAKFEKITPADVQADLKKFGRTDFSEQETVALAEIVRDAGCRARKVLETDSITQRVMRTADMTADFSGTAFHMALTNVVRGGDDRLLPPLDFNATTPAAKETCR